MAPVRRAFTAIFCAGSLSVAERMRRKRGPLDTPDMRPFDPVDVLCTRKTEVKGWCKTWVECIEQNAQPGGDAAAVLSAWGPADCKEVCGIWPTVSFTQLRAIKKVNASTVAAEANMARLFGLSNGTGATTQTQCETSCTNFKESLSSCVAMLIFEPGKVAAMGMPKDSAPAPEHCTQKHTPCMPELPLNHQKCIGHKTKSKISNYQVPDDIASNCQKVKSDMEFCAGCPQLKGGNAGHYEAFVGGCMTQLHLYYAATDPSAGVAAINMGENGCKPY